MLTSRRMKPFTSLLLVLLLAGWKLECALSFLRLQTAAIITTATTSARRGFTPVQKNTSPTAVDHSVMRVQHQQAAIPTPSSHSTAVFGMLPNSNPEDWQLFLMSWQDKVAAASTLQEPVMQFTNNLLAQSQVYWHDGLRQASSSLSQVQNELNTLASYVQSELQDQLSNLDTIQSSTLSQFSTVSTSMVVQVSSLSTLMQSGLVAQLGALILLWSEMQDSLSMNVQVQMETLQRELVEQFAALALLVEKARDSSYLFWQDETASLSKLLPSILEQLGSGSSWTAEQQLVLEKWVASFGEPLSADKWYGVLSQWQEQLSGANQMAKTVVSGSFLLLGAYFVFGPQPEETKKEESSTIRLEATAETDVPAVSGKTQLDLVLEQVSMVEKEHKELEQAIWKGNPPSAITSMAATANSALTLDNPIGMQVGQGIEPSPPYFAEYVARTFFSSSANYLGSSTVPKEETSVKDKAVIKVVVVSDAQHSELVLSARSSENTPPTTILENNEKESATSSLASLQTTVAAASTIPLQPETYCAKPEESTGKPENLRLSPTAAYLESLLANTVSSESNTVEFPSSQTYLESISSFQHPETVVDLSYVPVTIQSDELLEVANDAPFQEVDISSQEVVTVGNFGDLADDDEVFVGELPKPTNVDSEAIDLSTDSSIAEPVDVTVDLRIQSIVQDVESEDWSFDISSLSPTVSNDGLNQELAAVEQPTKDLNAGGDSAINTDDPSMVLTALGDSLINADEPVIDLAGGDSMINIDDPSIDLAAGEDTEITNLSNDAELSADSNVDSSALPMDAPMEFKDGPTTEEPTDFGLDESNSAALPPLVEGEERDWAALSDEISSDIWKQGVSADEPQYSGLSDVSVASVSDNDERDWAGLSAEIGSDIWNQGDASSLDEPVVSDETPLTPTGSGEPWPLPPSDSGSEVSHQAEESTTPRKPMTVLLNDEDNEIREYIKAKAAQKTRERLLEQQVARRNGSTLPSPEEVVVLELPSSSFSEVTETTVSEDIVDEPFRSVEPTIFPVEETIASKTSRHAEEASAVTNVVERKFNPKRLQRPSTTATPKLSKKRLLTAVAVVAVVVGQRALTAVLNRSLL